MNHSFTSFRQNALAPVVCLVAVLLAPPSYGYEGELSRIAQQLADVISQTGKQNVATVDFTDLQGNVTELGRFMAEELSTSLAMADKGFAIVDRTHLRTILAEQRLSISGLLDPRNAKKIGQIAGVDALVLGSIVPLGETVRLSIKVVATDTAKVVGAARGSIALTGAIRTMLDRQIAQQYVSGPTSESHTTPVAPVSSVVQPDSASFENTFLRVQVTAVNAFEGGKTVRLSLRFENISDKAILIMLRNDDHIPRVVLLDNFGGTWVRTGPAVGVQSMSEKHISKHYARHMTPLNPGQSIPVVLEFQNKESSNGTRFDFNAHMGGYIGGKPVRYTVSISGLQLG